MRMNSLLFVYIHPGSLADPHKPSNAPEVMSQPHALPIRHFNYSPPFLRKTSLAISRKTFMHLDNSRIFVHEINTSVHGCISQT